MNLFNIGKLFSRDRDAMRRREAQETEAENFKLAPQGGFISALKYALFAFFGYFNARLFLTTVPGFDGVLTAIFALAGEGTALYCLRNFTRSTGRHKAALGVCGLAFTAFSVTHAVFSFFKLEKNAATADAVQFYCENIAFPVLFSMLVIAAIALPLLHWRARVAAEQAKTQCQIAESRARMLAETARMRDETELENARLEQLEERLRIETAYAGKLDEFVKLKSRQAEILSRVADPQLRAMIAAELGVSDAPQHPSAVAPRGNGGAYQRQQPGVLD